MKTFIKFRSFAFMHISTALLIPLLILIGSNKLFADDGIELTGNITQLGTDFLVVEGTTFFIDYNTELRGLDGDNVPFSFFHLNDLVEVRGVTKGDGTYLATRVRLEDGISNENEIELTGYVTQVGTASFVINGNTFLLMLILNSMTAMEFHFRLRKLWLACCWKLKLLYKQTVIFWQQELEPMMICFSTELNWRLRETLIVPLLIVFLLDI